MLALSEISDMDNPLEKVMAAKTDDELHDILLDIKFYTANEVSSAISELQKRGKYFNEVQLDYLKSIIQKKRVDENPDTPYYYSPKAIFIFSVLCTVLYGSILLAMNLRERRDKLVSIGFGLTFLLFEITLYQVFNVGSVLILVVNAIGGGILAQYFWNSYLGKDAAYKKKSIVVSTIIAIVIIIIFIVGIIYLEDMSNAFKVGLEEKL